MMKKIGKDEGMKRMRESEEVRMSDKLMGQSIFKYADNWSNKNWRKMNEKEKEGWKEFIEHGMSGEI